jgi:translation initiation factor 3 subunit A
VWRRSTPVNNPTSAAAPAPPVRSESPAPKYRPGALGGGGGGGWRQREEAAKAAGGGGGRPAAAIPPRVTASPRPSSPAPLKEEVKKDADGFQTVGAPTRGVWRPTRGGRA